jgi:adenylate cyclase
MTLRRKTLVIIALTLGILFLALYLTVSSIVTNGFADLEVQDTRQNVQRVLEAIGDDVTKLETASADWGAWDDTYQFVVDKNEDYRESNLTDSSLTNLGLNLMLIADSSGEMVFGAALDLQAEKSVPLPAGISALVAGHDPLLQHADTESIKSGILLLDEGPLLIASHPILTSQQEGPIHGAMVMGRWLDDERIAQLAKRTQYALTLHRLDDAQMPPDFQGALAQLQTAGDVFVNPLSQDVVAGYTVLNDIYAQPRLVLRVDTPRVVFAQGQVSLRYLVLSLLALGLVFLGLTLLLLERLVLARLAQLSAGVSHIGASADAALRLSLPGTDELSRLAGTINNMLQALQDSLTRERHLKQEVEALRIEIDEVKRKEQVDEIVESNFFQDLQNKSKSIRDRHQKQDEAPDEEK